MLQESISIHSECKKARSEALKLGDFIYISGILPVDDQDRLVSEDAHEQIRQVFHNLNLLLKQCGLSYHHIMKLGIQLTDLSILPGVDSYIENVFEEPYPARTVTRVAGLCANACIQIDGIAVDTRALEVLCKGEDDGDDCCNEKCCTIRR